MSAKSPTQGSLRGLIEHVFLGRKWTRSRPQVEKVPASDAVGCGASRRCGSQRAGCITMTPRPRGVNYSYEKARIAKGRPKPPSRPPLVATIDAHGHVTRPTDKQDGFDAIGEGLIWTIPCESSQGGRPVVQIKRWYPTTDVARGRRAGLLLCALRRTGVCDKALIPSRPRSRLYRPQASRHPLLTLWVLIRRPLITRTCWLGS